MAKNCADFTKMYDNMKSPNASSPTSKDIVQKMRESGEATLTGKMGITSAINAYDKVFITEKKSIEQPKKVLTEKASRDQKLRMLGAIQVIKERLNEGVDNEDVPEVISMIKEIVNDI
jgi:hypothetical protein